MQTFPALIFNYLLFAKNVSSVQDQKVCFLAEIVKLRLYICFTCSPPGCPTLEQTESLKM